MIGSYLGHLEYRNLERDLKEEFKNIPNLHVKHWFSNVLFFENLLKLKIAGGCLQ